MAVIDFSPICKFKISQRGGEVSIAFCDRYGEWRHLASVLSDEAYMLAEELIDAAMQARKAEEYE